MKCNSLKISVVTVSYNAVSSIEKTMLSVLNQTYDNIEYILIDGGSTDGTVDIIRRYAEDPHYKNRITYWVSEPDNGIYDAMNKGIAAATGDYINFMNAGDKFYDILTIKSVFNTFHEEDVIYGDTINITNYCSYIENCLPLVDMRYTLPFSQQSTFIKTKTINRYIFDLYFKSASDYNQLYEIWKGGASFAYLPQVIAVFDARDGFSALNKKIVLKEVAEINGDINNKIWFIHYVKTLMILRIKRTLKKILPYSLVKKVSIKNIRNNPRLTLHEIY